MKLLEYSMRNRFIHVNHNHILLSHMLVTENTVTNKSFKMFLIFSVRNYMNILNLDENFLIYNLQMSQRF